MGDYLVHFNQNHNPKNGRFDFGDGDGDGQVNDRASLRERVDRARDAHRGRVLGKETYKVNKGNLKLRQDQIANQRHSERSSIKSRKMSLEDKKFQSREDRKQYKRQTALERAQQKRQQALEREQQRRQLQEERAKRLVDKVRQKSVLDLERAEARERKAQANASRNEAKRIKQEERAQQREYRAQVRADRAERRAEKSAMKEYQRQVKQQNDLYDNYIKKSKSQAGRSFVAFASGRPITGIYRAASAISNSNKAKKLAESSYYR